VKSRNPDIIWTVHQETRGEILFHRKIENSRIGEDRWIKKDREPSSYPIAKSVIGSWTQRSRLHSKNSDTRYRYRNPERTCEPSISEDRWQQIQASSIGISEFAVLKDRCNKTSNSRNRDTRNSDKISAVHLTGHVADIEETVGVSAFGVSS
jgi:hypothetical protein